MIFYIDSSVASRARSGSMTDEEVEGIQQLASAYRYGKHIILSKRETLIALAECSFFSQATKAIMKIVHNRLSTSYSISEQVSFLVRVVSGQAVDALSGVSLLVDVELDRIAGEDMASLVRVYVEDINDQHTYQAILQSVLKARGLFGLRIMPGYENGGGSNTAKNFRRAVESGQHAICIVDSDRKYAGALPDGTARLVLKTARDLGVESRCLVLDAHEVENLVPPEFYRNCASNSEQKAVISTLAELEVRMPDVYLYFDYKEGLKKCDVGKCQYMQAYWGGVSTCSGCGAKGREPCYIIAPFRGMSQVQEALKSAVLPVPQNAPLAELWQSIFGFFFSWCVAPEILRT